MTQFLDNCLSENDFSPYWLWLKPLGGLALAPFMPLSFTKVRTNDITTKITQADFHHNTLQALYQESTLVIILLERRETVSIQLGVDEEIWIA